MWPCQCPRASGQETTLAALPSWRRSCGSARCNAVVFHLQQQQWCGYAAASAVSCSRGSTSIDRLQAQRRQDEQLQASS